MASPVRAPRVCRSLHPPAVCVAFLFAVSCGSSSQTVIGPTAARCALHVEVESSSFGAAGGSGTLRVVTNRECAWTARADAGWVSLATPGEGQGDGTLRFTVAANGDPSPRATGISVNDRRLEITQSGSPCRFQLSSDRVVVDAGGGDRTLDVSASSAQCGWTATPGNEWILVTSGGEGKGDGSVAFRVGATSGPARAGTITIAGHLVQVEQGTGCSYSTGAGSLAIGAGGGPVDVPVSAPSGCGWTAASHTGWIGVRSGTTGSGSGQAQFVVHANPGPARTGSVTVAGRNIPVVQESGCAYSIAPAGQAMPGTGGSGTVSVTTDEGCGWTATTSIDWIGIAAPSGMGSGAVHFTVAPNQSIARTGTLLIAGRTFTVDQASLCTFTLSPPSITHGPDGGGATVLVIVDGSCTWTARSTVDWITIGAGASGAGNGMVQFTVASNPGAARTGVVVIAGQDYSVIQAGR